MKIRPLSEPQSPSSFPAFQPHVTLATSPDEDALRAALPDDQRVVQVQFRSLEVGDKYFMSVFVAVHARPGSPLAHLRSHLRGALSECAVPPLPHLSLYYIDDSRAADRQLVIDRLFQNGHFISSSEPNGLAVNFAPEDTSNLDLLHGFDADAIWVVLCDGPVNGWRVLYKQTLQLTT